MDVNKIHLLVANAKTEEALVLFTEFNKDEGILLQGIFFQGKQQFHRNIIDSKEWGQIQSKVNYAIVDGLPKQFNVSHENHTNTNSDLAKEYYKKGVKHIESKNYREAVSAFNEALFEDDKFAKAYSNRGFARIELDELREAITDFEKAIKLDSSLWEAHHSLGILYVANKQKEKGCECLKIAKSFGMSESENAFNRNCT